MITFRSEPFLITGASSGIGKAVALRLNELGAVVIAVARNRERLVDARNASKQPGAFFLESKDLSENHDELPQFILDMAKQYGKLKGLILCAGVQDIGPLSAIKIDKAKKLFDINFFANLALSKGFSDKRANTGAGSSVLFISSIASIRGNSGIISYSASKGALNAAVRSMAAEVSRYGIRVNALLPGLVVTEMIDRWKSIYTDEYLRQIERTYPLGLGRPEDVADAAVFLVSDSARWITGQCISVDGGGSIV